ncbi:hypothetical protein [Oleiphilus sp. HI0061]|uniref:5' nucleotidase, NT5C type n=1 Tax=Oleiphilus sp. HI0061 TaxID=1822239 RepID=UPI00083811AC|nr:hypothetical protein [Oleiphilus sp. HI0061]
MKLITYIGMDSCLSDYKKSIAQYRTVHPEIECPQSIPGFFQELEAVEGSIETINWLANYQDFDVYILAAPSLMNPACYQEKREWIETHLGTRFVERLILSPHKNLQKGHYLIDDNTSGEGQELFEGELIHFASSNYPNWKSVKNFFSDVLNTLKHGIVDEIDKNRKGLKLGQYMRITDTPTNIINETKKGK